MRIHIVQKGDTLWTIAKKYGVNFDELKKLNAQLSNPDLIMPGMKIKVPAPAGAVKKEMPVKEAPIAPSLKPNKEMPVAPSLKPNKEMPVVPVPKPNKEMPVQVAPVKEQPKQPMMPPLPPVIPEVEINQVFQMNMEQMQQTLQPPLPSPPVKPDNIFPGLDKKEESVESANVPIMPPPMPEIEAATQLQGGSNYPMNAYVNQYQMAPQAQGYGMQPELYPHWGVPTPMPVQQMPMPMPVQQAPLMPPSFEMVEEMMESSEEVSSHYPMMHYPSSDHIHITQEAGVVAPMNYAPMNYAPPMYPTVAPYQMAPYPSHSCCVPITPVMPGVGYHMPMEYAMESPEYGAYPQVMGAYQPPAYYPSPMMQQPYMPGYPPQQMMYPSGGMAMPNQYPPQSLSGKADCGCQRADEENEE